MGLIRFIFFVIVFYLVFKVIRMFTRRGSSSSQRTEYDGGPKVSNSKRSNTAKKQKDVIDAEFVEIKEDKDEAKN